MKKHVIGYLGAGLTFAAIDAVWLFNMTDRLYRPVLAPILAEKPDMAAAVAFYLIYISGIVFMAVAPALREGRWHRAALNGAVLGFVAYATYDLTNQATLKVWALHLTLIDITWGTVLTAFASVGGYLAARSVKPRLG
jgi:uncharacterized membrane protein